MAETYIVGETKVRPGAYFNHPERPGTMQPQVLSAALQR